MDSTLATAITAVGNELMSFELDCLTAMTLFFILAWLPSSVAKRAAYGTAYLLSNRDQINLPPLPPWGERSHRAYENLKSFFPAYAVAILSLALEQRSDPAIRAAALLFVFARVAHFAFYTAGLVSGRAMTWAVGTLANIYLLARIF